MTANTSPDNIPYPTSGDQVAPLETTLANMATGIQSAFTAYKTTVNNQLVSGSVQLAASAAARDALFPAPVQGNRVFRTDLMMEQTYFGLYNSSTNPRGRRVAGWAPSPEGNTSRLIPTGTTPVSVTGSGATFTVDEYGHVRATSASGVQLNGVLLRGVRRHIIRVWQGKTGANFAKLRFATAGALHTTGYARQYSGITDSSLNSGGGGDDGIPYIGSGDLPGMATIEVVGATDNPASSVYVASFGGVTRSTNIPESNLSVGNTTYSASDNDGFSVYNNDGSLTTWDVTVEAVY